MSVHRLVVRSAQGDLAQGTAWAVAPGLVCSAFHVVGHCGERRWMHELVDGTSYWLEGGAGPLALTPEAFDADADLALLSCAPDAAGAALALADFCRKNVPWAARGYPGFHKGREFTLSGHVVDLRDGESARAVQLKLEQGAHVNWGGISGAAVVEQLRVIAVITSVTDGAATAWASPVEAVHRLVKLADLGGQVAQQLARAVPPGKPREYIGFDRRRLGDVLEHLARERPDDPIIAAFRKALAENHPGRAPAHLGIERSAALRDEYDVIAVRDGGRIIRPVAPREFAEILGESRRFGGRYDELAKLDRHVSETPAGYCFVTGESGYGKTSLLARWIDILRRRGETTIFHFFTARVPDSLDAEHAFGRLGEQLLAAHGLGGDPPRDRARLQALYVDLLALPAPGGRPLIVVLDGLDEASETLRPAPAMFPHGLGDRVHVVFSARKTADREWLTELELPLGDEARIDLGRLLPADIEDILTRTGLASDAALVARLLLKTDGDPFYVADVVRVLAKAGGQVDVLDDLPATHSAYLRGWWKEAVQRVARAGFIDLMGTLAALREPLGARELAAISKEDELANATIGILLEEAARYVEDDGQGRYWLRHDRIRSFVRVTLGDDIGLYDGRVRDFALRWNDPQASEKARAYGRRHVIAHLLAADCFEKALELLDADFIAARWRTDGSYSSLLTDLDAMLEWAAAHLGDRLAMCHVLAVTVMRESARGLMRDLPPPLCRAWVRIEGQAQPLDMLASLPSHRGEAREPLLAVAGEILDLAPPGDRGRIERAIAGEMLARTIGMLPLVRAAAWALDALAEVCRLLAVHPFETEQAIGLLKQGIAYANQVGARDLKAACLAHLAAAVLPWDRGLAASLLREVELLVEDLPLADQAATLAIALPASRALAEDRLPALVRAIADKLLDNPAQSSFSHDPLQELLSAWAPDAQAAEVVRGGLERRAFSLPLLCKLELADLAWKEVEGALESDTPDINLIVRAYDHMPERRARLLAGMAGLVLDDPRKPGLAQALILAGRWSDARRVLAEVAGENVGELLSVCLTATLAQAEGPERDDTIEFIIGQLELVPADDAAKWTGEAAHALAKAGHTEARPVLSTAFRLALTQMPEGDVDDARQLVAVDLASGGQVDEAIAVALAGEWWHRRIQILLAVLRSLPADSANRIRVAGHIGELMKAPDKSTFLLDAVRATCEAALELGPVQAAEALRLVEAAEFGYLAVGAGVGNELQLLAEVQRARASLNRDLAAQRGANLLGWVRELASGAMDDRDANLFPPLFALCARLIESGAAQKEIFDHTLNWACGLPLEAEDKIALAASAGAAAALIDQGRAAELFRDGIECLMTLQGASGDQTVVYFRRLIGDLTGTRGEPPWVKAMEGLVRALVDVGGRFEEDVLADLLQRAWERTLELAGDKLQGPAQKYLKHLSLVQPGCANAVKVTLQRVLADLEARRGELDVDSLLSKLAFDLGVQGHADSALDAVRRIVDDETRDSASHRIALFTSFHALQDRSAVERNLFDLADEKGLAAVMVGELRKGHFDDVMPWAINTLKESRVRSNTIDWAIFVTAAVMKRWGADAGKELVQAVADFDRRLLDAASDIVPSE